MLACSVCDRTYGEGPDEPWRCSCGGPLEFETQPLPDSGPPAFGDLDIRNGLWAFESLIRGAPHVTLGEGFTPLVDAPAWDAEFKLEYVFPSGSFKDRGATTVLSRASELGVERVVEDSSGNAGAAIALYAARAGIEAEIYVPAEVKESKLRAIRRTGASAVRIDGGRRAVSEACIDRAAAGDAYYASHAWNPAFFEGTKTVAIEICAQRDWAPPDAVVAPLGHGTLVLGAYWGFSALHEAGWIDRLPRLLCAQAAGTAPIADRLHGTTRGTNRLADGIQIAEPVRLDSILEAIEATDGDAIQIDGQTTEETLDRLHRAGFYVEPTSAVAPAALDRYREAGVIGRDEDVIVPLTGSGLKS